MERDKTDNRSAFETSVLVDKNRREFIFKNLEYISGEFQESQDFLRFIFDYPVPYSWKRQEVIELLTLLGIPYYVKNSRLFLIYQVNRRNATVGTRKMKDVVPRVFDAIFLASLGKPLEVCLAVIAERNFWTIF